MVRRLSNKGAPVKKSSLLFMSCFALATAAWAQSELCWNSGIINRPIQWVEASLLVMPSGRYGIWKSFARSDFSSMKIPSGQVPYRNDNLDAKEACKASPATELCRQAQGSSDLGKPKIHPAGIHRVCPYQTAGSLNLFFPTREFYELLPWVEYETAVTTTRYDVDGREFCPWNFALLPNRLSFSVTPINRAPNQFHCFHWPSRAALI